MPNRTISLPTPPEVRQKLEVAGFMPAILDLRFEYWDKNGHRYHLRNQGPATVYQLRDALTDLPLADALEFASLVGISPTGYRMIPEEVAQEFIVARDAAINLSVDAPSDVHMTAHVRCDDAETALVAALSGESPKEDSLSTTTAEPCPMCGKTNPHCSSDCEVDHEC